MSQIFITKKELQVPVGAILDVADVLIQNEITHEIVGTDSDEDTITLVVQYDRDERKTIHEIEDIIADFMEQDDRENDTRKEED